LSFGADVVAVVGVGIERGVEWRTALLVERWMWGCEVKID
jgi:hypothetical protein